MGKIQLLERSFISEEIEMTLRKLKMAINKFAYYLSALAFLALATFDILGIDLGISIETKLMFVGFMVLCGIDVIRDEIKENNGHE